MKWVFRIVVVLVLLFAALLWFGWSQLDKVVKFGIETGTPPVVQTSVKVAGVKLSPFSGVGVVEGFEIGNPQGFTGPRAVWIGRTELAIDTTSTQSDKIVVKHIHITDPEINLEAGLGGTNLKHIAKNAQDFVAKNSGGATAAPAEGAKPGRKLKLQVNEIVITGGKVSASAAGIVPDAKASATLPEIRLSNLGTDAAGVTPAELTALVLSRLSTEAAKSSASGQLKSLLGGEGAKLDAGSGLKKIFGK